MWDHVQESGQRLKLDTVSSRKATTVADSGNAATYSASLDPSDRREVCLARPRAGVALVPIAWTVASMDSGCYRYAELLFIYLFIFIYYVIVHEVQIQLQNTEDKKSEKEIKDNSKK